MKILAMGDIHGKCREILNYLEKNHVDLIILTGDITHFGPLELVEEMLNEICIFNIPTLAIPGNCDPKGVYSKIENSNAVNIHGNCLTIKDISICGFGGSNPTPFNTPLEFDEILIYEEVEKLMNQIKDEKVKILVTHTPPFGTKADIISSGDHVGSESIRKIIDKFQPTLNICGHIHEAKAVDNVGNTIVINPGESSEGFAAEIMIKEHDGNIEIIPKLINL